MKKYTFLSLFIFMFGTLSFAQVSDVIPNTFNVNNAPSLSNPGLPNCTNYIDVPGANTHAFPNIAFDITSKSDITIDGIYIDLSQSATSIDVYTRVGTHTGNVGSLSGWSFVKSFANLSTGPQHLDGLNTSIATGSVQSFLILSNGRIYYTRPVASPVATNSDLDVSNGTSFNSFGGSYYYNTLRFRGGICYSSCNLSSSMTIKAPKSIYQTYGANAANTYYYGLNSGGLVSTQTGGTAPYTYQWSNHAGYPMQRVNNKKSYIHASGPTWVVLEVSDAGGCTVKDSLWMDYVDYTCNPPGQLWYYQLCRDNSTTVCVKGTSYMRDSLMTGNYSFGACALEKRAINENTSEYDLKIFPNPSHGQFTLNIKGNISSSSLIQVFDLNGRLLFSEVIDDASNIISKEISLTGLATGIYMLKVSNDNASITERIQIQ